LWISAFGGQDAMAQPAILAADLETCEKGYSLSSSSKNQFENDSNGKNPNCDYTSAMSGTSLATPLVSGVVALMVTANPNLGWRDVKHILAKTAKKIDPTAGNINHPSGYNLAGYIFDNGWIQNAAGYNFHKRYGFGLIDATAAVQMAKSYLPNTLGNLVVTEDAVTGVSPYQRTGLNLSIPDNSAVGRVDSLPVNRAVKIESVQLMISVDHTFTGDLGIELTSPNGTKSVLANINSGLTDRSMVDAFFLSNAFYGESSVGTWTLKIVDGYDRNVGSLKSWSLKFWGSNP
jgi:hypothetical protein